MELIKGRQEKWPVLETEDAWYCIASSETMDRANEYAMEAAAEFLIKRDTGFSKAEVVALLGVAADLEVCNFVDPRVSARLKIPKILTQNISF